jgi:hypothetical protein
MSKITISPRFYPHILHSPPFHKQSSIESSARNKKNFLPGKRYFSSPVSVSLSVGYMETKRIKEKSKHGATLPFDVDMNSSFQDLTTNLGIHHIDELSIESPRVQIAREF